MPSAKALLAAVAAASSVLVIYFKQSNQAKDSQRAGRRDVAKPFVVDLESTSSPNKRIKRIASRGPDKLHDAQSPELKKGTTAVPTSKTSPSGKEPALKESAPLAVKTSGVPWPEDRAGDATVTTPKTGLEPPPIPHELQESLVRNLQNESLAHQVILDSEFQLTHQSTQGSGGAMQRQVEEVMKKAYWDMVNEQTAKGEFKILIDNLKDIKAKLQAFIPSKRLDMHAALERNFDIALLEQQITHKAFDAQSLNHLLDITLGTVLQLEAPARNHSTNAWLEDIKLRIANEPLVGLLPFVFDFVTFKMKEMSLDVSNWQLRMISGWLSVHGVTWERQNFVKKLEDGGITLKLTEEWAVQTMSIADASTVLSAEEKAICNTSTQSLPSDAPSSSSASASSSSIERTFMLVRFGLLRLLRYERALSRDSCPEILWLDITQLVEIQNTLQAITLVGALLMIAGAHLSEKGVVITADSAKQFKNDIFVLLAQPTGSLRHLREYLHRFVGKLREEAGVGELSETEKDFLTRMADKTANTEDSFYVQMNGKVVDVLWRVLRCREEAEMEEVLTNLRLAMKDELSATCRALRKIATHNYSVHMDLLSQVFQTQPTAQASEAAPAAQVEAKTQ
eukprot:CAMPEP_0198198756 /NCGR_PEP_ID=MMETSP1445-20131203/2157_1 /TAXON_ID=36898 /ORGANISM="Pyramimonas sp., Strain CCMP2087" /LENGTH=623 /DNA_ID=CAMNT_0043868393 /DNA_START=196 /DNA_END=2068 /DNA_ORIENTATION=-